MGVINFCKYTSTTLADMLEGASMLTYAFHGLSNQSDYTPTMPELLFDFKKVVNPTIVGPIATSFNRIDMIEIDAYTLDAEGTGYAGGVFLGNVTPVLRQVDLTSNSTVLNDMLATSLWYLCNGNTNIAFAFIQTAFKLIAMYMQQTVDIVGLKQNQTGRITPYGL